MSHNSCLRLVGETRQQFLIGYRLERTSIKFSGFYITSIIRFSRVIMSKLTKRAIKKENLPKMEVGETGTPAAAAAAAARGFDVSFWPGKRLVLSNFKGRLFVHVRVYEETNGRNYPTKKGASFTPGRLRALHERIDEIDAILTQLEVNASYNVTVGAEEPLYKVHLGGGIFVTIDEKFHGVNLRRHWMPPGQNVSIIPTKNGIYLPTAQWIAFKLKLAELLLAYPGLLDATVCNMSHGGNQMETFECRECTPFGYDCV